MRHHIKHNVGNCLDLDDTTILHVEGEGLTYVDLKWSDPEEYDHDYDALPAMEEVSEYKEAVINYICGYVVRYNIKQNQRSKAGRLDRYTTRPRGLEGEPKSLERA